MDKYWILICTFYLTHLYFVSGQLPQTETLRNITKCDFQAGISLTCAADEVIAIHSLHYAYIVGCNSRSTCCDYSSSDCLMGSDGNDIQYLRRQCSGHTSCSIDSLKDRIDFRSFGVKDVSYVVLQYYCIPYSRLTSICASSKTLQSDGLPLYITNENYPSITTSGSGECSCSLEVFACSSNIDVYIIDADLFYDTSLCEQNIEFKNGTGTTLSTVGCEVYYTNDITTRKIGSHYSRIDFINNSTSNQEGQFFLGFKASETGVTFILSCQSETETWCTASCAANEWRCTNGDCISNTHRCDSFPDCSDDSDEKNCGTSICPEGLEPCQQSNGTSVCIDKAVGCNCGAVPSISNGNINLISNSIIGSVAKVTCDEGYIPSSPNITCQASGLWETAVCAGIDCGTVPSVAFGKIMLIDSTNQTYGATASVKCYTGYEGNTSVISCQSSGLWQTAVCVIRAGIDDAIFPSCTSSGWNVTVNMTVLQQLYPRITSSHIYFGDNSCRGRVVGNLLVFQQGFRDCLTSERISGDTIFYENDLFYAIYDPINPFIIRQHKWTYTIECDVSRNEATSSHVHHDIDAHHFAVSGHYNISMAFFKDPSYMQKISGNPIHANVGDNIYVKVFTSASDWSVKMRLHTCYTKPTEDADRMIFYIIKDGCEVDSNTHIISQSTHETRFVFQDFEYSTNREGLNIYCNATFCESQDYSPGCAQSCQTHGSQVLVEK